MVEHESHLVSVAVDAADAALEGGHEVVQGFEEHIGDDGSLQVAPEAFDQIQLGNTVGTENFLGRKFLLGASSNWSGVKWHWKTKFREMLKYYLHCSEDMRWPA